MKHKSLSSILTLTMLLATIFTLMSPKVPAAIVSPCNRLVGGDRAGLNRTTHGMAADGKTATGFQSSYNNWQYLQIDFSCVGDFSGVRRYMTRNSATSGRRVLQGEGIAYSVDGVNWINVQRADTTGWESYVGYATAAWHSVPYGWSSWLRLKTPVKARFLRFRWDGDADVLNEIEPFFYEPPRPDPQIIGLNALREMSRTRPHVRIERGIPRFVTARVPIPATLPNDPVVQALDYLKRNRQFYRFIDPLAELYPTRISSGQARHLFFGQHKNGVPVYGARLGVHLSAREVLGTNGSYLPVIPDLPAPTLSAVEAERIAAAHRDKTAKAVRLIGAAKLMYFNNGLLTGLGDLSTGTRLVHRVVLEGRFGTGVQTSWTYFVDAHNGAILRKAENVNGDPPDKDFDIESALGTDSDEENWFTASGSTSDYQGPPSEDLDLDGRHAWEYTHTIYDYFFANFHRHSYDDGEDQVEVTLDLVFPPSTSHYAAKYTRFEEVIYVTDGSVSLFRLGHEFTHGVNEHSAALENENESGAINESFADIFGALISGDFSQLRGTPNHELRKAPLARDPECDRSEPNWNDCGYIHTNSAIPNNAANLIINGGTLNGVTVPAIGADKAQQLFYRVLTNWLSGCSNFRELRDATVAEARSRIGPNSRTSFTSQDVCTVVNSFAAVGLGPADANCDGVEDGVGLDLDGDIFIDRSDNCPSVANPDQRDLDGDGAGDVCDLDDDGDSRNDYVDNCPLIPNARQQNRDGDALGDACDDNSDNDGVIDMLDNCPFTSNSDQKNSDTDNMGNACDTDDDNDTRLDPMDNCPLMANTNQANSDSDGLGDACDNCDIVFNPNQLDTNRNGLGDACDPDDDGDGIMDDGDGSGLSGDHPCANGNTLRCDDNCPTLANPQQIDTNNNGVGLECDTVEQRWYYGSTNLEYLLGTLRFQELDRPLRIPIEPCASNCPDWFPPDYMMKIDLELPFDALVRVVDERGAKVMSGGAGKAKSLRFRVDADYRFKPPTRILGGDAQVYTGRTYYLEISPAREVVRGKDYSMKFRIRSGRRPF